MSTREGFPELFGLAEIADYAEELATEAGDPPGPSGRRVTTLRVLGWIRTGDWASCVADLTMGRVYLAEEVGPYVMIHLERGRKSAQVSVALPSEVRERIAAAKGSMSVAAAAEQFGASARQVHRIWYE